MKVIAFLFAVLALPAFANDRWDALSMLETGHNDRAIGKAGEVSRYQVLKPLWLSVTNSLDFSNPETARAVALRIMGDRARAFEARFGRTPTDFEFYALWNAPAQVMNSRVSRRVAERSERFANLCERNRQLVRTSNAVPLPMVAQATLPLALR